MTPDQKTETMEETARLITARGLPLPAFRNVQEWEDLTAWVTNEILSALRNERERCGTLTDEYAKGLRSIGSHLIAAGVEVLADEIRSGKESNNAR